MKKAVREKDITIDANTEETDTCFQEMVMLSHKVDRQEKWIHLLADKLGVKLEY